MQKVSRGGRGGRGGAFRPDLRRLPQPQLGDAWPEGRPEGALRGGDRGQGQDRSGGGAQAAEGRLLRRGHNQVPKERTSQV